MGVAVLKWTAASSRALEVAVQTTAEDRAQTAAPQPLYSDELASSFFVPAFHSFWAGWEDGGEHYAVEPLLTILPLFGDHTWCCLREAFFFVPVGGCSFVGKAPSFCVLFTIDTAVVIVILLN